MIETLHSDLIRETYFRLVHKSGLTVCVMPKKAVSTYAVLASHCGSIDNCFRMPGEKDFVRLPDGTAHFLEHKLFASESGRDAIAQFAELGAAGDAYTSFDTTAYLFSCTERVDEALRILLGFVTHPYFTEENIAKEIPIIEQEIRMYDDAPGQTAYFNLMESLYHRHPVRINVAGTAETIRQITPDILYRLYHAYYQLSNMTLVVAGDITPERVLALCDEMLPAQTSLLLPEPCPVCEPPDIVRPYIETEAQVSMPLLYIGIKDNAISPDPLVRMKKAETVGILNDILFSKSSRFFNDLYEKGLVNGAFGFEYEHAKTHSYALLSAETEEPGAVADCFFSYVADVQKNRSVTKEQFERCKRVMYAASVMAFESTEDMAGDCLDYALDGGELFASIDCMASLTLDDLYEALDAVYDPGRMAVSVVRPMA